MLALLLTACSGPEDRVLGVADDDDPPVEQWVPPEDSPSDTGDPSEWTARAPTACGAAELPTGADVLSPDWCVRLSPEAVEEEEDDDGATPPCGFVNLIGSVAMAGTPEDPALLYCDADTDGGLRFVRVADGGATLNTRLVAPGTCWADPGTGAMREDAAGLLTMWVDLTGDVGGEGSSGLAMAHLGADGVFLDSPSAPAMPSQPWNVAIVAGESPWLVVRDMDRALYAMALDAAGAPTGAPVQLAPDVESFAAADGPVVATCDDLAFLDLRFIDGPRAVRVDDAICGFIARPSLASGADRVALAWDDGAAGTFALFTADGVEILREDLGEGAVFPAVGWDGQRFVVADAAGGVRAWTPDGEPAGAWRHPHIEARSGLPLGMRLLLTPERWTFLFEGSDVEPAPGGHVNTYHYLEASTLPAP